MAFDPFSGDSGLPEGDFTIESAVFIQNDQGDWPINLVLKGDDGSETTQRYSIGKQFSSFDGGESVSGPKADSRFNTSTAYFKFMQNAIKAGANEVLRERSDALYEGMGPMHANLWAGLRFNFEVKKDMSAREPDPDKAGSWRAVEGGKDVSVPVKYLGVAEGASSNNGQASLMDSADLMRLAELARESETFAQFGTALMKLSDSSGDPMAKNTKIMSQLNQAWYEELRAS